MLVANYIVAQNVNPFVGLGQLGSELNDLRSLVVFVILLFGLGMLYLLIDKNRQRTKRFEVESRTKIETIHAEEEKEASRLTAELTRELIDVSKRSILAIEQNSNETREFSKAFTEAIGIIGNLPAGIIAGVEILANRNLEQFTAQGTGIITALQRIDSGISELKNTLKEKHWLNSADATKVFDLQARIDKQLQQLIKETTGEIPVVQLSTEQKKEGET